MDATVIVGTISSISISDGGTLLYYNSFEQNKFLEKVYFNLSPWEIDNLVFVFSGEKDVSKEQAFSIGKNYISLSDKEKIEGLCELLKYKDIYFIDLQDVIDTLLNNGILLYSENVRNPIAYIKIDGKITHERFSGSVREFVMGKIKAHGRIPLHTISTLIKPTVTLSGNEQEDSWILLHKKVLDFLYSRFKTVDEPVEGIPEDIIKEEAIAEQKPEEPELEVPARKKFRLPSIPRMAFPDTRKVKQVEESANVSDEQVLVNDVEDEIEDKFELVTEEEKISQIKKKGKVIELIDEYESPSNYIRESEKGPNHSSTIISFGLTIVIVLLSLILFKDEKPVDSYFMEYRNSIQYNALSQDNSALWLDTILSISKDFKPSSIKMTAGLYEVDYVLDTDKPEGVLLSSLRNNNVEVLSIETVSHAETTKVVHVKLKK